MAEAITSSAGSPRFPTVHRAFISKKEFNKDEQELLKGYLLLNQSNIIISQNKLNEFVKINKLPDYFKNALEDALSKREDRYIKINESRLFEDYQEPTLDEVKALAILLKQSESSHYNKINIKTDEYTFKIEESIIPKKSNIAKKIEL